MRHLLLQLRPMYQSATALQAHLAASGRIQAFQTQSNRLHLCPATPAYLVVYEPAQETRGKVGRLLLQLRPFNAQQLPCQPDCCQSPAFLV